MHCRAFLRKPNARGTPFVYNNRHVTDDRRTFGRFLKMNTSYTTLIEAVRSHAAQTPERPALIDSKAAHTYSAFLEEIYAAAAGLKAFAVGSGDRIVCECSQDASFMALNLACSLTGCIFVGVERRVADQRLTEISQQTDAALILTLRDRPDLPGRHMTVKAFLADERTADTGTVRSLPDPHPEAACEILFSTGTTGKSKGVLLTNRANIANAQNIIAGTQMEEDSVEVMPLPLNHAHGLRTAYAHLLNGSTCLILNGITLPRVVLSKMEEFGANAMDLTPSAAEMLIQTAGEKLHALSSGIRYIEVGAAFLPESTKEKLRECFPTSRLYNFYGSSESGRCCVLNFAKVTDRPGCIGKPVPNASFCFLDEDGNAISSDAQHTGILACRGTMNMNGYWNEPELTQETIRDGYVVTADLSYMDSEGYIYVLGRRDDVINYKGIKISPEEIEEAALTCDLIKDCACVPLKDELAGQVPKLFVVIDPERKADYSEEALFEYLKSRIDDNRMPRKIEAIDEIPRTYNGKIQRKKLMQ